MLRQGTKNPTAAVFAAIFIVGLPTSSIAGVMSVTSKDAISLQAPTEQVDWRPYPHRHHRYHYGWHYGWPRYRYGMYAGWNPRFAPPAAYGAAYPAGLGVYGSAYPAGCGVYGSAYPAGCGVYGAGYPVNGCGAGFFGSGGGLFGLGLGFL